MKKPQYWKYLEGYKYGCDEYGILRHFKRWPTPADLADCFEGTSAASWGNILNGRPAGGIYAEIISGIKRLGFMEFICDGRHYWKEHIKNKSERHLQIGRRYKKVKEKERQRLPYTKPLF